MLVILLPTKILNGNAASKERVSEPSYFSLGTKVNFDFIIIKTLKKEDTSYFNSICKQSWYKILRYKSLCDIWRRSVRIKKIRHMTLLCEKVNLRVGSY